MWKFKKVIYTQTNTLDEMIRLYEIKIMSRSFDETKTMSRSFESGIKNLADAYIVWKFIAKKPNNGNSTNEFFNFLGIKRHTQELTQEASDKINWLLSPHAETLYKAWKLRNG